MKQHFKCLTAFCFALITLSCSAKAAGPSPLPHACTEMACTSGLTLAPPPDYIWKPGNYEFTMTIAGKIAHCQGRLPLKSCNSGNSITCDRSDIMIMEQGCALPPDSQSFGDIQIASDPHTVNIVIERDGVPVFRQSIVAAYKNIRPNGAQCEPSCRQAKVDIIPVGD